MSPTPESITNGLLKNPRWSKKVNIMKVTVNLNLDPVAFYQQKMLLVELTDKFFDTYHNGDLDNMLQGIIAIFDEIGDQAEFQGEFEYPQETDDGEHFKDEQYNNVFSKLFNHKPLEEAL